MTAPCLRVALGIMFFWTLAMLANLNIDQFAFEGNATKQTQVIALLGSLIVGVGIGSVLAGLWSGGKVELGILPIGAGGLALFSFLLYTVEGSLVDTAGDVHAELLRGMRVSHAVGCQFGIVRRPAWRRTCRIAARPSIAARFWPRVIS